MKILLVIGIIILAIAAPGFAYTCSDSTQEKLSTLEKSTGVRLGISAVNTANNEKIDHHSKERFPIQSTFKVMAVSAILKKSMKDPNFLQEKITYTKKDLVTWSPITENHLKDGMTVFELCAAAMMYSDNTAVNLLMKKLGGPKAVTQFARSIGDHTFRVDSWEAELNSNPNDLRDTSTPIAMMKSLEKLTLGKVLGLPQREQLVTWMKNNTTGDSRIRAGVPKGWVVADKTGAGSYGISNDIGILWPPKSAPIFLTIYSIQNNKDATRRDDVIASATRIVAEAFQCKNKN